MELYVTVKSPDRFLFFLFHKMERIYRMFDDISYDLQGEDMKDNTYIDIIIIVFVLLLVIGFAVVTFDKNNDECVHKPIAGYLRVVFYKDVNITQINETFLKFNLSEYSNTSDRFYFVEVPIGEEEYFSIQLRNEYGVEDARQPY